MSIKDMVIGYAEIGEKLNDFIYEGKVKNNVKSNHTKEELEEMIEEIRKDAWGNYKDAIEELKWR